MSATKTIKLGETEIRMRASALIPRLYRYKFGRDIVCDMRRLQDKLDAVRDSGAQLDAIDLTVFEDIAWLLCKHADPAVPDDPDEWLDGIPGVFDVYSIFPEIADLWGSNLRQTSFPAKK